jgi:copper chaperone NosL
MLNRCLLFAISFVILTAAVSTAAEQPVPGPDDKCPVCGMFVAHYQDWITTVVYQDQVIHYFDGPKDLFTYLLDMEKWAPGRDAKTIQSITVKEYYGLSPIDAHMAFYVIGSDVLGPMGHELIPFATLEDAKGFMRDHKGKKIYRFDEIDSTVLSALKSGTFK